MPALSPDSQMPRQFSSTFLHPPNVSEVPTRRYKAGARVNWKANTNSFPTGPLGLLNHSTLTFKCTLYNWVGISCLLHSSTFNASPCLVKKSPNLGAGTEDSENQLQAMLSQLTCPHPWFHPQPIYSLPLGWGIVVRSALVINQPKTLTESNSYSFLPVHQLELDFIQTGYSLDWVCSYRLGSDLLYSLWDPGWRGRSPVVAWKSESNRVCTTSHLRLCLLSKVWPKQVTWPSPKSKSKRTHFSYQSDEISHMVKSYVLGWGWIFVNNDI